MIVAQEEWAHSTVSHDCFSTPPHAVMALVENLELPEPVYDPAAGTGNLLQILRAVGFSGNMYGAECVMERAVQAAQMADERMEFYVGDAFEPECIQWVMLEEVMTIVTSPPVAKLPHFVELARSIAEWRFGVAAVLVPDVFVTFNDMEPQHRIFVPKPLDYSGGENPPKHYSWLIWDYR